MVIPTVFFYHVGKEMLQWLKTVKGNDQYQAPPMTEQVLFEYQRAITNHIQSQFAYFQTVCLGPTLDPRRIGDIQEQARIFLDMLCSTVSHCQYGDQCELEQPLKLYQVFMHYLFNPRELFLVRNYQTGFPENSLITFLTYSINLLFKHTV